MFETQILARAFMEKMRFQNYEEFSMKMCPFRNDASFGVRLWVLFYGITGGLYVNLKFLIYMNQNDSLSLNLC